MPLPWRMGYNGGGDTKAETAVNSFDPAANALRPDERHPNAHERQGFASDLGIGDNFSAAGDSSNQERWLLITVAIIILLWLSYFAGVSALLDMGKPQNPRIYIPRGIVTVVGILISLGIVGIQFRMRDFSLARRAVLALVAAIIAPAVQALINVELFNIYFPGTSPPFGWVALASDYYWRVWIWMAAAGTILAMSYAAEIRERERRIIALQNLAHSAQLRALRFQLNPHFLFNALNSVVGLISSKRVEDAETVTESLADFLRMTLALDPQRLISLDEELRLQTLYLDIEKKRFAERLAVQVDVPDDLRAALIPSLITQPLIENTIKYAVARSNRPVELTIAARKLSGQLELVVADDGGDAREPVKKGACLGLRNVADRLREHYGDRGSLTIEPLENGGFLNRIVLPVQLRE